MAAQTEAPDDLIAELARLMADDARESQPATSERSTPVRIPGDTPAAPIPRYDFSASAEMAPKNAPSSPVRIPGSQPEPAREAEPFNFNFDLTSPPKPSAPAQPEASAPATKTSAQALPPSNFEMPSAPEEAPTPLDQDSLADLIAAELAADIGAEAVSADPAPSTARVSGPDNFGVPPVFGLGTAPQAVAPSMRTSAPTPEPEAPPAPKVEAAPAMEEAGPDDGALDPLDEIERLVGPAVRMNVASASPAPALRSLATPTVPEPVMAVPARPEPQSVRVAPQPSAELSSVDEAILAAAAATGAHVEWVNAGGGVDEDIADDEVEAIAPPPRSGFRLSRAVAGPLVAVCLLAVAGFGLYWALGQGGGTAGPAPLLVADTTATKEIPEADTTEAAPQSVVFNEISGADPAADEQIVSRDQADTEAVVAANSPISGSGVLSDVSGDTVDPNQDGLVNRKVRTVTVRPDGTIVSGDDSLAGSAILPVDRPNVPDVPGADFSTPDLIASVDATTETPIAPTTEITAPAVVLAEPGAEVAVVDAAGAPIAGRTVTMPMQRPSDFSTIAASALASATAAPATALSVVAPAAPAQQTSAAVPNSAGSASAYVQLASQRSEDAARQSAQAIATRYGVLFGGAAPEISRVDLGERGIYYRVVVPAPSRENAANICANVRAAGGDCLLL